MRMNEKAKSMFAKTLLSFAFAFAIIFASGTIAKAATTTPVAPGQVTEVKQTDATTSSVKIEWKALLDNKVRYSVQIYDGTKWIEKTTTANNYTYVSKGLNAGTTYKVKVQSYVKNGYDANGKEQRVYGPESAVIEAVTIPNSITSSLKHTKSAYTSITVSWATVPGANTYLVEYGKSGANANTYKQVTTTANNIELKNLSKNSEYTVRVSAGRKTSTGTFVKYSGSKKSFYNIPVRPYKVNGLSVPYYWQYIPRIKASCNANMAADGYQWQLYTAYKSKDTKVKSATSTSNYVYLDKSVLKKHNFYKVKVRAYCTDGNGKKYYSAWTSWKYVCPQPDVKLKNTSNGMKVSWDKIQGADRYVVYMSTKKDSVFKKVATTKNTSKVISKIGKSKLKSGKTYYVRVVAQNKVGKKYYSGAAGNATKYWSLKYKK